MPIYPQLTMTLTAIFILLIPLFQSPKKNTTPLPMKSAVKLAFLISTIPLMLSLKHTTPTISMNLNIMSTNTMDITSTITMTTQSTLFLPVALFVTWSIMEFSTWYMPQNPTTITFMKYLTTFLIAMLILVSAGSMIQLFIGWEGVGIMSFLLINWWFSRMNANSAAMQAIIYNRIGDVGLLLVLSILATTQSSWNMEQITALQTKNNLLIAGLIMAAMGKSAQFFMHMWLPAAMEGPTPVSALLHSSTMVVAGIYLLIQLHPILESSSTALSTCSCIGATTSLYAAACALAQNDIKKIIAFSTTSQLGLMMVTIGINLPQLALLHISTHAMFKALLFISSGSIIHNTQNDQDIRKMGNLKTLLPVTTTCMTIGSLALMGTPFLSGFYSKDAIIEALLDSHLNAWTLLSTMIATTMTSAYSLRMMFYTLIDSPRQTPALTTNETHKNQTNPMLRLTLATIFLGTFLLATTTMTKTLPTTLPMTAKLAPLTAMMTGIYLAWELKNMPNKPNKPQSTLNQLMYYHILHRNTSKTALTMSQLIATQLTDLFWLEKIGPKTLETTTTYISKISSQQKGLMKNYMTATLITIILALMLTHNSL
uniref:NADH-ubiquinone oxidoreductase chain 5 n=1 Tax=Leiolepis reevesii TaxID=143513 RepID=A0A059UGL9_9SAUR|nr:NADH dehydrogenase subunit 5 [Leiolepis reevesii]AHZ61482.1 NADH dehydrogenase subunit 5 [Leiolepis reevesii]